MSAIEYSNLTPWTMPADYVGATWYGWYTVYSQNRDSDALERSNYRRILEDLKALDAELAETDIDPRNVNDDNEGDSTVTDTRVGHWAVGWAEVIYVHSSNTKACELAQEILSGLEDYGCYDESDFSAEEHEDETSSWDSWARRDFERALSSSLESWMYESMDARVNDETAEKRINRVIEQLEDISSERLAELFHETADSINEYWVHGSDGASINVDKVAGSVGMRELMVSWVGESEAIFSPELFCRFDPFQMLFSFVA